jgi:serine/threonine-protein kinase
MIVRDGLVKITDFGIARMRTNEVKTMTGMILGSPKYMSPEQVAGKRADHRADLFSLGVVLYEMLTGEAPFLADSIHGIMYQILNFTPPAPSARNPALPEMVDLIVAKALAKGAEERYQTARDFADDLKSCREMLAGKQSGPGGLRETAPGEAPAAAATRKQDRLDVVKAAPPNNAEAEAGKGLALAKSFDSYEATLRLAALTGQEANALPRTQQAAAKPQGEPATVTTARPEAKRPNPLPASAPAAAARSYAYLWIFSAVALVAAAAVYLLR